MKKKPYIYTGWSYFDAEFFVSIEVGNTNLRRYYYRKSSAVKAAKRIAKLLHIEYKEEAK